MYRNHRWTQIYTDNRDALSRKLDSPRPDLNHEDKYLCSSAFICG